MQRQRAIRPLAYFVGVGTDAVQSIEQAVLDCMLDAFQNEVNAQTGKSLDEFDAEILKTYGEVLKAAPLD
jgi:hypothetical protein